MSESLDVLFGNTIQMGNGSFSLFFLCLGIIYIAAWLSPSFEANGEQKRKCIWYSFLIYTFFICFCGIMPYWVIYVAPFTTLLLLMMGAEKRLTIIMWVAEVLLIIVLTLKYTWVYGGTKTFSWLVLRNLFPMESEAARSTVAGAIRSIPHMSEMVSGITALFVSCYLVLGYVFYLRKFELVKKNMPDGMKIWIWFGIIMQWGWFALSLFVSLH